MAKNLQLYQQAIEKGNELNERGEYGKAFNAFRIALGEFKNRPEVFVGLGEACIGQRQYGRALDCYKMASRLSRGDIQPLSKVSDLQERLGQLNDAARTYFAIGEINFKQGHMEEAVSNWERATRLDPNLLSAHKRLALVFHREGNVRATVREYLAIARILSMQGENQKALQICQSALKLDPGNTDIIAAMRLVEMGEEAFPEAEEEETVEAMLTPQEEPDESTEIADAVRQMASIFEEERGDWQNSAPPQVDDPVAAAKRQAQEDLSSELFREEDESDEGSEGLMKLERDALIGQGLDFQSRGEIGRAITCYEKAIQGGLELAGAYFMLGTLYLQNDSEMAAFQMLEKASGDPRYAAAVRVLLS